MSSYRALNIILEQGRSLAKFADMRVPDVADGQLQIEVWYSSINYKDALAVTGRGRIIRQFPCVAGIDAAGYVTESKHSDFAVGDPVIVTGYELSQTHDGGYAELLTVPADWVVPLPKDLSLFDAMALGTAGFTAALAIQRLFDNGLQQTEKPIIVTGATGGVGSFAIDILNRLGFKVTAVTGKAKTADEYLQSLGATQILDRQQLDFTQRPLESAQWGSAIDTVGGEILSWLLRTTDLSGSVAACGLAAGVELNTSVMPFILRGVNLLGIASAYCPMPLRKDLWARLANDMRPTHLDQIINATLPLDKVLSVAEQMLAGQTQGRYLVAVKPGMGTEAIR